MTSLLVTAASVRAFTSALGGGDAVPPTFAIVPVLKAVEDFVRGPSVGLDWSRVVHRGQTFTYARPIVVGDVLTTRVRLRDNRTVRGSTVVRVDTDVLAADGTVCSALTTLVARGAGTDGAPPRRADSGDIVGSARLSLADVVRYAAAAGDRNPIHLDPAAAAAAGLPGVIAHGMLTMGIALRLLLSRLGPAAITSCSAVFSHPVVVGPGVRLVVRVGSLGPEIPLSVSADGVPVARVTAVPSLVPSPSAWSTS